MSTFSGSYVQTGLSSNARINQIVDYMVTPRILAFRQVSVYNEAAELMPDGNTWNLTYGNWNPTYPTQVRKNGLLLSSTAFSADNNLGAVRLSGDPLTAGDNVTVTYNFDYFPIDTLCGFIYVAIDTINNSGQTSAGTYTISDAPTNWDGTIADIAVAIAMERLMLDYDLWKGRLIFAIPNIEEGGDIISVLESIKRNAEERAYKSLDNEKFKWGNYLSAPTQNYYNAVRGYGRGGQHTGTSNYGKLRGWRNTKYI